MYIVTLAKGQVHLHQSIYTSLALPILFFKNMNIILIQFLNQL